MTKNWLAVGTASESSCLAGVNPPVENMDREAVQIAVLYFSIRRPTRAGPIILAKAPQVSQDLAFFGYSIVLQKIMGLISCRWSPHPELDDKGFHW